MSDSPFTVSLQVRDYECDLQGIVNNSVYQNYLEHARHLFLQHHGIDFAKLTEEGIFLVVTRVELDYKQSLRPGEWFDVSVSLSREGRIRWVFDQEITRKEDRKLILKGRVFGVSLNRRGRPENVAELESLLS